MQNEKFMLEYIQCRAIKIQKWNVSILKVRVGIIFADSPEEFLSDCVIPAQPLKSSLLSPLSSMN